MQGNRSRDTRPELAVRSILHRRGYRFRVAARPLPSLPRTADVVFRADRVAVFIDGCFWHGCPTHAHAIKSNSDYWAAKLTRNHDRDAETNGLLVAEGWTVLRYWSHDSPASIAGEIEAQLLVVRARPPFNKLRRAR